jgi:7-carboxy-7-deazaguanine synthase (Cx14CxxC type)
VFIRFAGCNLWSGRETDRASAVCRFCDTDFVGGAVYSATNLAAYAAFLFPGVRERFCVLTGGEPLLQVDAPLIEELRKLSFVVAVETNGTKPVPAPVDWLCVSPKAGTALAIKTADEIKVVYPQSGLVPHRLPILASWKWISPMSGVAWADNVALAVEYCRAHPEWRLAIQAHKYWYIR